LGGILLAAWLVVFAACSSQPEEHPAPAGQSSTAPRTELPREQASPSPQPAPDTATRSLAEARGRSREEQRNLIRDLILDGVFANIELQEGVPRVHVRPGFYLLTFSDQQSYMAVVYAFAFPEGAGDRVVVIDAVSGKEKGAFTESGLQLSR
jgi:hypothetical protein